MGHIQAWHKKSPAEAGLFQEIPWRSGRQVFLTFGRRTRTAILALGRHVAINQFDHSHVGRIAMAHTSAQDAGITTRAGLEIGSASVGERG